MADKLTPEQLAQLQRLFSTPVESGGDTNAYMPEAVYMDGRTYDKQDSGFLAYDYNPNDFTDPRTQEQQSLFNGSGYDQYGKDGSFSNSGIFTGIQDSNKAGEFLTALAMMAPMFAAGISPAANAAMSFGTNPVMSGLSNSGAIFSGTAGLTGAAGAGGATSAMGAGADPGLMNGLNGSDIMSDAFVSNGGYGAGGFGGTNGSYMSNLLGGSGDLGSRVMGGTGAGGTSAGGAASTAASAAGKGSSLLGIGSTLLGAAAGAKGQEAEQSSTRDIPEWLKPYAQKVLGMGSGLLDQQMTPQAQQGFADMRTQGMGLLNQPVAGNGTSLFPARQTMMRR